MLGNIEDGYTFEYYSYTLDALDYLKKRYDAELDESEGDFDDRRAPRGRKLQMK